MNKNNIKNKDEIERNLNDIIEKYIDFTKTTKKIKLEGIVGVVYSNIFYPFLEEIDGFYYLGGQNIYIVLKTKCKLYEGRDNVLQVIPSKLDIEYGKPPIIPIGCPPTTLRNFPKGLSDFEKRL